MVDVTLKSPRVTFAGGTSAYGPHRTAGGQDLSVGPAVQDADGLVKMKVQDTWPYDATVSLTLPKSVRCCLGAVVGGRVRLGVGAR